MFVVRCVSPLDGDWEARDAQIKKAAGATPHASGAAKAGVADAGVREHEWRVGDFRRAVAMKDRLNCVAGCRATVQEAMPDDRRGRK